MTAEHAIPRIVPISVLPLGMVNAFAILGDAGCVLVDAGLPDSEHKFERALRKHDRSFDDVSLIVVTHGHIDHAGGAEQLRRATGAPVAAHRHELPYLTGERRMTFCPTGWFGRWFLRTGAPLQKWPSFDADIVIDDAPLALDTFGVAGHVRATPGHTPGSVSVTLPHGAALVGDMLASGVLLGGILLTGRAQRPPFEERPHEVADEIERLAAKGARTFYLGHGGPLPVETALRHAQALRRLPTHVPAPAAEC